MSGLPPGAADAALWEALHGALSTRTLFGFDFDGTLAPIQAHPDGVAMDARSARAFAALTRHRDVAVVTGRSVADVRPRLSGAPRWVVGNHGAEGLPGQDAGTLAAAAGVCGAWRAQLAARLTDVPAGIFVEDKTYSLCLHYRQAGDHAAARALLAAALQALRPAPRVLDGKCVFNLLPAGCADKFDALAALAAGAGLDTVFFIGDDVTDETVFRQAPPAWVTVKVGMAPTAARFRLPGQHAVAGFLERLLAAASVGA